MVKEKTFTDQLRAIWKTTDGYHFEDLLARGRCLRCGRLAVSTETDYKGYKYVYCSMACNHQIIACIDDLKKQGKA